MAQRSFNELLARQWAAGKFLCVGLDSDYAKLPRIVRAGEPGLRLSIRETVLAFNRAVVEKTAGIALAFKPNIAFYEKWGEHGLLALRDTITFIRAKYPEVPVILDAKRGNIGDTNAGYVDAAFEEYLADAVTVSPYLGADAMAPFLAKSEKGILVLAKTSNKGSGEFQDREVDGDDCLDRRLPLWEYVAHRVAAHWNTNGNCGIVVGATHPIDLRGVRQVAGDIPILIPGIGKQGGDLEAAVAGGKNSKGEGMIINASSSIIFASSGEDFAEAARAEAERLDQAIREALAK